MRKALARSGESAVQAVYLALKHAIFEGRLEPGARLREEDLSEQYQVSRTPVREALRMLEVEELVTTQNGRGMVVAEPTHEEIMQIYELREALGGVASRLAAERATDSDLFEMEAMLASCERAIVSRDVDLMLQMTVRFDRTLWQSSKNGRLVKILEELQSWQHRSHFSTLTYPGRPQEALAEHRALFEAIRERNVSKAESIARDHMRRSRDIRIQMDLEDRGTSGRPMTVAAMKRARKVSS